MLFTVEKGQNNIAFNCFFQTGDIASCIDVLIKTDRAPEAALFARTYAPSAVPATVKTWKHALEASGKQKIAQTLADPEDGDEELFEEGWVDAINRERSGGRSSESAQPPNGETIAEPYEVKEDGETSPQVDQEPSKATQVIEDLVDKAKELVVGDDAQEPEAGESL
jgi:coatomer subunit beta'